METTTRAQHTPGPWHLDLVKGDGNNGLASGEWSYKIRGERQFPDETFGHPGKQIASLNAHLIDEVEPNARLIASAPDLLAALEEIMNVWVRADGSEIDDQGLATLYDLPISFITRARTAIAKARGDA